MPARLLCIFAPLLLCASFIAIQLPAVKDDPLPAENSTTPFLPGHDVLVSRQPDEAVAWKLSLLREANQTIEFFLGFTGGALLQQALDIVYTQLKSKPDLSVRFFISDTFLLSSKDRMRLQAFASAFPDRFFYLVRWMTFLRQGFGFMTSENHIKMLLVDNKYCVIGGSNFLPYYGRSTAPAKASWDGWADYMHPPLCIDQDILVRGPIVHSLRKEFYQLWDLYDSDESPCSQTPFSSLKPVPSIQPGSACCLKELDEHHRLIRDVSMKAIVSGPRRHLGACTAEYAKLIKGARDSIDLMHMFVSPVEELFDSLIHAANRGVSLTLVTNAGGKVSPFITHSIGLHNRAFLFPLLSGRKYTLPERKIAETEPLKCCHIYNYAVHDCLYHKKIMVVDKRITVIGSYNMGQKSHYGDYELIVESNDPRIAKLLLQTLEKDKDRANLCKSKQLMDWYFGIGSRSLSLLEGAFIFGPLF